MKKINSRGFLFVETIVVIAVVGIVLTYLFRTFSSVYTRFSASEYYNTVSAVNAAGNIKQYIDKLNVDYQSLLNGASYVDITASDVLLNDYYSLLKSRLGIEKVYLIDIKTLYDDTNAINSFNIDFRNYLKTLEDDPAEFKIVIINSNNEYGSIAAFNYSLTLQGDSNNEYATYVAVGDSYVEPGYQAKDKDGNNMDVLVTGVVDTSTAGTYYLNYNVGALTIRRKVVVYKKQYLYDYTGNYQVFTVPVNGDYEIELWGAQVPSGNGKGAYTKGDTYLFEGQTLYIYVGQSVATGNSESFNGGISNVGGLPGGGATDVRLIAGDNWKDVNSLRSRIMVAAGAGAGNVAGANGGALTGLAAGTATGGTQTSAGTSDSSSYFPASFGIGGGGCGGGGGFYGGGSATCANGGAGGSSYISGYSGCNAVIRDGTQSGQSVNYSGYRFINTQMIAGNASMPNPRGSGTIVGNNGAGYARITLLSVNAANTLQHVRYIYNEINGSSSNAGNHWVELQAFDLNGTNIALGNTSITASYLSGDTYYWGPLTDGVITSSPYITGNSGSTAWVRLDLGAEYDLSSIQLWHYFNDSRTYYGELIKVAGNDLVYRTVQLDNYKETSDGFIVRPVPNS